MKHSRYSFWSSDEHWPREPEGSIFLARAMIQAAPLILGHEVDPAVFSVDWVYDLPLSPQFATPHQIAYAQYKIAQIYPDRPKVTEITPPLALGLLGSLGASDYDNPRPMVSQDDWDELRRQIARRQEAIYPYLQQRGQITDWFAREIYDRGTIALYACLTDGGPMLDLDAHRWIWNVKWPGFDYILRNCAINEDNPKDKDADPTHYLFLDQRLFERTIRTRLLGVEAPSERLSLLNNPEAAAAVAPRQDEASEKADEEEARRTGFAGRPSSKLLIVAEVQRRAAAGEPIPSSKAALAAQIVDWLAAAHPTEPQPTAKTVKQNPEFMKAYQAWHDTLAGD